jgi:gamma-glutamylcyclotransferase (GGCT)/AIG2-like uncharacterized protein YtfP
MHFAYGTAFDRIRLPADSGAIGPATLADVELAFAAEGALVLRPRLGQTVSGVLFHATAAEATDACTAIRPDGSCVAAMTQPGPSAAFAPPSPADLLAIRRWRQAHGLDTDMLDQAASGAPPAPAVAGLFVYGTLLPGEVRGQVLPRLGLAAPMQPAHVLGRLLDLGDYPGLVLDGSGGAVQGEVAFPRDFTAALPELDGIEDARPRGAPGGLYRRTLVAARPADGHTLRVWTYVLDAPHLQARPTIRSGNWRDRWK